MDFPSDFNALLALFNAHGVEYVIVGGYALAQYGAPRFTGDIELLVKADAENAKNTLAALDAFGFASLGLTVEVFDSADQFVQLGFAPQRIDVTTSITGVTWEEVHAGRVPGLYGDVPVSFIGRAQLVANKRASGTEQDLADLEALGEAAE